MLNLEAQCQNFFVCFSQGTAWEHILTDLPFISITVGCKRRVWGIAENGTAYFRAGFGENSVTGIADSVTGIVHSVTGIVDSVTSIADSVTGIVDSVTSSR